MKSLLTAIQFLTILPMPSRFQPNECDLRRSLFFFPVVGLILGAILALLDIGVCRLFPALPTSVLMVIAMLAVSGGFHMDGLSDTADGFFSSRPKERILEIMKDSRVGPMGVIAIVCVIALKISMLTSVPERVHWNVVAFMPIAGRCALVFGMRMGPYARPQGGLASAFGLPGWTVFFCSLLIMTLSGWLLLGIPGLVAAGLVVLSAMVFSVWCRGKIGGFTGDTLGSACEIAEIMPALVVAAWRWTL
jgi:adenosylcobinamide-GDP ribazoletransferase